MTIACMCGTSALTAKPWCSNIFAAMIGRELLRDPEYLDGARPVAADLWRWHATEEVEHKGLSFDVWLWGTPGMMRRMFGAWAAILKPGFHPWDHDDRTLMELETSPYADAVYRDTVSQDMGATAPAAPPRELEPAE
ncbi:MAG: metal-dependent hydrolase [Erythrobacter sp.]